MTREEMTLTGGKTNVIVLKRNTKVNCVQVGVSHLYTSLCQFGPLRELLSGVDVGVVCPLEGLLELLQLLRREGGAAASLFPLQGQVWLRLYI